MRKPKVWEFTGASDSGNRGMERVQVSAPLVERACGCGFKQYFIIIIISSSSSSSSISIIIIDAAVV